MLKQILSMLLITIVALCAFIFVVGERQPVSITMLTEPFMPLMEGPFQEKQQERTNDAPVKYCAFVTEDSMESYYRQATQRGLLDASIIPLLRDRDARGELCFVRAESEGFIDDYLLDGARWDFGWDVDFRVTLLANPEGRKYILDMPNGDAELTGGFYYGDHPTVGAEKALENYWPEQAAHIAVSHNM